MPQPLEARAKTAHFIDRGLVNILPIFERFNAECKALERTIADLKATRSADE